MLASDWSSYSVLEEMCRGRGRERRGGWQRYLSTWRGTREREVSKLCLLRCAVNNKSNDSWFFLQGTVRQLQER